MLTTTNPLAGLDALARQGADAGITMARDIIIDARLWNLMAKDDYVLSPIMINNNVVDLTTVPATDGNPDSLEVRPVSAFYDIIVNVQTVAADRLQDEIQGLFPEGSAPLLQTFQIEDPPAFALLLHRGPGS